MREHAQRGHIAIMIPPQNGMREHALKNGSPTGAAGTMPLVLRATGISRSLYGILIG